MRKGIHRHYAHTTGSYLYSIYCSLHVLVTMSYRDSRGGRGGDYRDRDRGRGDRNDRNFGGGRYDRNDGGGRGGGGRNRNFGVKRYRQSLHYVLNTYIRLGLMIRITI